MQKLAIPPRQEYIARKNNKEDDPAGRREPDHRRQPVEAHYKQDQDAKCAAHQIEAIRIQRFRAVQQFSAKLTDWIADAGADDEACPEQKIDRKVERAQPADRENQIHDPGVVTQKRDDPDEEREHRQHQRGRAGLALRHRVTRTEAQEAGQHGEILVE